jgi:hypothetical protein
MKFNFGKQKATKLGSSIDKSKLLTSQSRVSVDRSRMSFLSSMTDNGKEEETEQSKNERVLQTIITDFNIGKKLSLQDYCIENSNNDLNFLTSITSTNQRLGDFVFTSPKEEGEKSQLVERSILDKYREENSHNEEQIKKLNLNITDMKNKLFKSTGENNFIKQGTEFQNKQKSDNAKQIIFLQDLLEECKTLNKNLKDNLTEKRIQKDALFNALYNYMKKYDENMAIEMKSIIYCYNKQLYMMNNKGVDEKYIDSLFSQIKIKEKLLTSKNKEIKELERFLIAPLKKKGKNKKDKKKEIKN